MVTMAVFTYFTAGITDDNAVFLGVCSKVGIVLLTIALAWPSLEGLMTRTPTIVNGVLLAALVFIAIRPRLMPLLIGGVLITLVVHFGLRFASLKIRR